MKNVLHSLIIYRINASGLSSYHFQLQISSNTKFAIPTNINDTEIEKIAGVLVLIHLRVMINFEENYLNKVSEQVFSLLTNLLLSPSDGNHKFFLKYFFEYDQSQIDWRMSFFDKLLQDALP